eukprot:CAMPEP_0115861936 /NCGR_PEP_ID=MMETSP0287-20121206/17916_1 /TAXON_ID=412157 /ORGANISM="Chrysochromulina rotalis, Strain UIO044" /LENGTH=77 /DNA_ID=CAMNT_0003316339 /DNA_START=12 /DNA_END=242 /DNA_ORIENTATION=+
MLIQLCFSCSELQVKFRTPFNCLLQNFLSLITYPVVFHVQFRNPLTRKESAIALAPSGRMPLYSNDKLVSDPLTKSA